MVLKADEIMSRNTAVTRTGDKGLKAQTQQKVPMIFTDPN